MKTNIRIVPIQQLCVLCGHELHARDTTHGLAGQLCRACIRLLSEQVFFRELEQHPKIVRVYGSEYEWNGYGRLPITVRGRDASCLAPPAQIPASDTIALGSCLESSGQNAPQDTDDRDGRQGATCPRNASCAPR